MAEHRLYCSQLGLQVSCTNQALEETEFWRTWGGRWRSSLPALRLWLTPEETQ